MLWLKMWRDLKENKTAYLACVAVISIGLMVFTSVSMVLDNLEVAKDSFYRDYRFAHGFARVKGMPDGELKRLAQVDGVADIEGRVVKDVRVLFPQRDRNVFLRLVSLDPHKANPINGVKLLQGSPLEDSVHNIWVSPDFFSANGLKLGQVIPVLVEGKKVPLRVVGTGQSPEFVYALRTGQDLYPSPETFGIAYLPLGVMKALFGQKGLINDLVFLLEPGYAYQDVEDRLKPKLEKYGLESIFPRKDQVSNVILTQELVGLRSTATTLPVLFLIVAAVILYILVKRTVEQQRGQIGTLKAYGYSGRAIVFHYLSYALIIGVVGGVMGGVLGIWLSFPMTGLYRMFFNLPDLQSRFSYYYLFLSITLSVGFSLFAGYHGSKGSLRLQPAEAMRPPAPPIAKRTMVERVKWFWHGLTVQGKMATRNLFRNKQRSFFIFLGVTFTFMMMAVTWYFQDISNTMLEEQFDRVQTYQVKMTFASPVPAESVERELARLPGVQRIEPVLEIPVTLKSKWHKKDVVVLGLRHDARLYNILTKNGEKVPPPRDGILLSDRLAELLGAKVGTRLVMDDIWSDTSHSLQVVGVIPQYLGINAYMEQEALNDLLRQGQVATSVLLAMDEEAIPLLKDKYRETDLVASIEDKNKLLNKYRELMESYGFMTWVLALFAVVIGFAVIYSSSIVSLSERKRELASLRVLGMTPREVLEVLTFEQWFISFFAMLAGIPLTYAAVQGMARSMNNDIYSIPVKLEPFSFILGFAGTGLSIWIAQRSLAKKIHRLSLVDVLKERD